MEQSEALVVAFSLASLTYFLSPLMMNLHKKEWVAWGIVLRNDSMIAMVAIGAVSFIQILLHFVQQLIVDSSGASLTSSSIAYSEVMAQLTAIEIAFVSIMAVTSVLPTMQGLSIIIGYVLGPAISATTGSIILWVMLQSLSNVMPVSLSHHVLTGLASLVHTVQNRERCWKPPDGALNGAFCGLALGCTGCNMG